MISPDGEELLDDSPLFTLLQGVLLLYFVPLMIGQIDLTNVAVVYVLGFTRLWGENFLNGFIISSFAWSVTNGLFLRRNV